MKSMLPIVAALCAAALYGLTPPAALAADPAPAAAAAAAAAPDSAAAASHEPPADVSPAQGPAGQKATSGGGAPPIGQDGSPPRTPRTADRTRPGAGGTAGASAPGGRPLDLSAPPVNHVMTPEQVQAMLDQPDDDPADEVMVEEQRYESPVPRGQLRALAWALMHPLDAWRIFTPVTDE